MHQYLLCNCTAAPDFIIKLNHEVPSFPSPTDMKGFIYSCKGNDNEYSSVPNGRTNESFLRLPSYKVIYKRSLNLLGAAERDVFFSLTVR